MSTAGAPRQRADLLQPRAAELSSSGAPAVTAPDVVQRRALHHLHERLGEAGRGVVVMPCGSGKTLLGRWFAEQVGARLTVVFVPSLALVPQTVLAYRQGAGWRHRTMIVCSDETSGRAVRLDDLGLPAWAREAVTASTSWRRVHEFITAGGPAGLVVSTYHSAPRVAAALRNARMPADLVVCDEAHRLTGRPRAEFRAVLDELALPARRRVFLTATPVEAAAWAADVEGDGETVVEAPLALDDEQLFGPTIYRATFADAVTAGRLVDYDVHVLAHRDAGTDDRPSGLEAVLTAAADGATRILTFHSRVFHARDLARALDGHRLPDGRTVRAEHVKAQHSAHRRADALGRLADPEPGTVRVLASARVLTEGIDVPAVDTVVFAEPRTSAVDIVQAVGRAMRLSPGKDRGRVVLAVETGRQGVDEDTELASTAWRHVWVTLRALASMDPRFAAALRSRLNRGGRGTPTGNRSSPGLRLDVPAGVDLQRWVLRALDHSGASWWVCYDHLAAHAAEYGAARPSRDIRRGGVALGSWVVRQRTLHRQGVLDPDRTDALQKLPGWAWDAREIAWWTAAKVWTRRHATGSVSEFERWEWLAEVPTWPVGGERPARAYASLAEFAVDTCARRRRGELPAHLERAADHLPGWTWDLVPADDAALVDALRGYAEWEKDVNPAHDQVDDETGLPIGAWLTAVRRRHYTGRLHPALELELQLLDRWDWQPLRWEAAATGWRLGYLALRQYVDREGTARMSVGHMERLPDHELNLYRWCVVQRFQHRNGQLTGERAAALSAVPHWQWEIPLRSAGRPVLADVEHGTRTGYSKGCRCCTCTDAATAAKRDLVAGGTDLVDAGQAREHLRALLGRGAGRDALARASGVSPGNVDRVIDGVNRRIRPENEAALLAVTFEQAAAVDRRAFGPHGELVDARPTWKLLDWMVMRGWPKAWISREIGQVGRSLQLHKDRISKSNADKVAELDRRLGRTRRPPARARGTVLPTLEEILAADQAAS